MLPLSVLVIIFLIEPINGMLTATNNEHAVYA